MNEKALEFFENLKNYDSPNAVKLANNTDFSEIDAKFILKYVNKDSAILDLGSGSGLIVNKIYPFVASIVCVDKFQEFTKFITKSKNITIHTQDLFLFETKVKFDIISAFGVMHYMNEEEAIKLYAKYKNFLKVDGFMIIKNQFGVEKTIEVSGYSTEQKTNYYAQYRYIETEKQILTSLGYEIVEVCDIYPRKANRWDNTHFYAIVAKSANTIL